MAPISRNFLPTSRPVSILPSFLSFVKKFYTFCVILFITLWIFPRILGRGPAPRGTEPVLRWVFLSKCEKCLLEIFEVVSLIDETIPFFTFERFGSITKILMAHDAFTSTLLRSTIAFSQKKGSGASVKSPDPSSLFGSGG